MTSSLFWSHLQFPPLSSPPISSSLSPLLWHLAYPPTPLLPLLWPFSGFPLLTIIWPHLLHSTLYNQVRYLVKHGPTLDAINTCDTTYGRSALCQCVFVEDTRWAVGLAYILVENGAKVHVRDNNGQ